jgi:basic amino acid/polyamine antiporter, APA family
VLAAAWVDTLSEAAGDLLSASRVALAMGTAHEIPSWLGRIHARFRSPYRAVLALGVVCSILALLTDLRAVLVVANAFTLVWYGIVHVDALKLRREQRLASPIFSWLGLASCVALLAALAVWALIVAGTVLVVLVGARGLLRRRQRPSPVSPPTTQR